MELAVLVPVKRFAAAKARLAGVLSDADRVRLARWLGARVLAAARDLPRYVACDDDGVADWAESQGAEVLWTPGLGLNGAVDHGRETLAGKGFDHVVIAHSDLPLAEELGRLAIAGAVTLVPDRRVDGTNVMALPAHATMTAAYGGGSFRRHLTDAMAAGYPVEVRYDAALGIDVDTPDDLGHPRVVAVLPDWLAR